MALAITLHLIAALVWVGGMFFAHMVLRPCAEKQFEPKLRIPLLACVFARFFPWVWVAIFLLFSSGFWIIFGVYGGFGAVNISVHLMLALTLIMLVIFSFIWFVPYKKLRSALIIGDVPRAGMQVAQIRRLITINLVLGMLVTAIGAAGRYLF